jgi:hypothetical protein
LEVEDEEFLRTSVEAIEVNRRKFENRERERGEGFRLEKEEC